jgi:hypothetical protein
MSRPPVVVREPPDTFAEAETDVAETVVVFTSPGVYGPGTVANVPPKTTPVAATVVVATFVVATFVVVIEETWMDEHSVMMFPFIRIVDRAGYKDQSAMF